MQEYNTEVAYLSRCHQPMDMRHVLGRQALQFVNLAYQQSQRNIQGMMQSWADIERHSDRWIGFVIEPYKPDHGFLNLTKRVAYLYADAVADHIVNGSNIPRIGRALNLSSEFFKTLCKHSKMKECVENQWKNYTHALVGAVNVAQCGEKSRDYYYMTTQCMIEARLLGEMLNQILH